MDALTTHTTTFNELHVHALGNYGAAYNSLPQHTTLNFVVRTQNEIAANRSKLGDVSLRLVLGHEKTGSDEPVTVYAYLVDRRPHSKAMITCHDNAVKVSSLASIHFHAPFDRVYDALGATDRCLDRICTLVGFYFLAAGHVTSITTRCNFVESFKKACVAVQLTNVVPNSATARLIQDKHVRSVPHQRGSAQGRPLVLNADFPTRRASTEQDVVEVGGDVGKGQLQLHTEPPHATIPGAPLFSAATRHGTAVEGLQGIEQALIDIRESAPQTAPVANPPRAKTPDPTAFTAFIHAHKKLKSDTLHLHHLHATSQQQLHHLLHDNTRLVHENAQLQATLQAATLNVETPALDNDEIELLRKEKEDLAAEVCRLRGVEEELGREVRVVREGFVEFRRKIRELSGGGI